MKGLDTNVLVRLLVADDAQQTRRVVNLMETAEKAGERFHVSMLVLLELAWVLDSAYACSRDEIFQALERLTTMPVLQIENLNALHRVIAQGRKGKEDIADLMIGACATANGCASVMTFDKRAARHTWFERL